ncbi:hypothetical protein [Paenibacillus sp. JCM 10914]|uniref:hypothetical protein n=1 Tax=Paenibacillus sp. JCM 10914 TaxID=1236974 RepID=UPI0003CCB762|nr:hypothetical protein JCM10914_1562 [Paenibacillus sp. JCM 10914]
MSEIRIERADMKRDDDQFVGYTVFTIDGHSSPYEITFLSKNGRDWDYSLSFAGELGKKSNFCRSTSEWSRIMNCLMTCWMLR